MVFHLNRIGIWIRRGVNLGVGIKIAKDTFFFQSAPRSDIASRVTTLNLQQLLNVYQQQEILFHLVSSSKMDLCQICGQFHKNVMECEYLIFLCAHNSIYFY